MKRLLIALLFAGVPFAQNTGVATTPPAARPSPVAAPPSSTSATAPTNAIPEAPFHGGPAIDAVIADAIKRDQLPGAIVTVGHNGRVVYQKAYGSRSLVPAREPMTLDTVFDIASLTKVVATTSSIMKLVEEGKVRLGDKVTQYIPEYQGGTSDITVRQLLTHYSGLRPDIDLTPTWSGYEAGVKLAIADRPTAPPDSRFVYSDINFILLGEIVRRASGQTVAEYSVEKIFQPLGMKETSYVPAVSLTTRIAPTEIPPGSTIPLRGVVHDPTTRAMGGVAGHAGVFSTAADLANFAQMMLDEGTSNGVRIFSPLTVRTFTSPQSPRGFSAIRGLGWDIDSPFSGSRGDLFPVGSFGHTGFTGTSMWIDPSTNSYVILLANSVHPKLRAPITPLRSRIASVAASGLDIREHLTLPSVIAHVSQTPAPKPARNGAVLTGLDVLMEDEQFASVRAKRLGIITNHTGVTRDGKRNIDAMVASGAKIVALFSPEHGIHGKEDREDIDHARDAATGLTVWSLYGGTRRPSPEMLNGVDALVFDIQDIGARFYTYSCTMVNALEEAARRNIEFIVLDRPNPINGIQVEGPVLEPGLRSFVGCLDVPLRHGMTIGELALMANASLPQKAKLRVIPMKGWQRSDWWDETGLTWVNPSPNMRSLNAALLYPGIAMLEAATVYSVGRGTDAPFEQVGASWIRGRELANYMNNRHVPGVRVYPTVLRPTASNFSGQTIQGIRLVITDRNAFQPTRFGVELAAAFAKLYPGKMDWSVNGRLVGSKKVLDALAGGVEPAQIETSYAADLERFRTRRAQFLLY